MKKLLAIALCVSIYTTASSQVYIQGGVNLANITKNSSGATSDKNMLTTFNAGILGRVPLAPMVSFETGLLLDGRGSKSDTYYTSAKDDNYVKASFNPLYLEVPANLVFKFPIGVTSGRNIFVYAGPYAAMGIGGKSKIETKILGSTSTSTETIQFNDDNPSTSAQEDASYNKLKRFDFGLNVGGGINLGKVILKANYGFGFNKINSTQTNNSDNKNKYRTVSISLGIPIGLF